MLNQPSRHGAQRNSICGSLIQDNRKQPEHRSLQNPCHSLTEPPGHPYPAKMPAPPGSPHAHAEHGHVSSRREHPNRDSRPKTNRPQASARSSITQTSHSKTATPHSA